jgi:LPXTG-motif cell wall-anchored protein
VGGDPKCDGHKLPCLFEAGYYEPHYMTTGSKERIFPHTFVLDISYDAVGGGRVDVLRCSVCDYIVPVKSHVHDYGWNWDCTGFGSIYEYTFNIGGSTKTVEQLILESGYAHPEKCKVPGCEEFIMVPHSWGRWNVVKNPDTEGDKGGMEAECSVCEYKETKEIDGDWTKDTALVTVKNGRATRMIVKPGDKIRLYPEERTGQKAIGWKVEYRREYNEYDIIPVTRNWNTNEAKTLFKLVTNGSALEWGCTIPEFSAMGAPGGGSFFFEPVYASCDHSGGTTLLNAKEQVCDRKGYTGDTACADCGGTVKGETGDFRHSGPLELRDVRTATCTERGYSGNQYCTSCDRIAHKGVSTPSLHEIADNCKLINEVKPGCTTSGYSGDQQCTAGCGQIIRYGHVVNKLSHDWDGGKPAKQGKSEGILYTCQRADCGETRFVRSPAATEFTVTVIKGTASVAAGTPITDKIAQNTVVTVTADAPEAGKVFDKWVVLEGNVTLTDATKATTTFTMPGNDVKLEATYKDAPPSHTHSYGTEWKYDDTDHWHECECGDKANIEAHSASEWIVDTAATETADGTKHKECTVCKKVLETAPIPATGSNHTHSYGTEWKYDGTNHWHECECGDKADTAAHNFQWEIDKAATKEATGIKHEECTVCGAKRSENTVIDKLPDGGNTSNTGSSGNNTNKPGNDDSTKCPQTGDSSNHIGWLAALCGVLTLLGVSGKKRKKSEVK